MFDGMGLLLVCTAMQTGEKEIAPRITAPALSEIQAALKAYYTELQSSDLSETSQGIYMVHAENFVRWLKGEFSPGSRKAPYALKKRKKDTIAS
jgi:hypothetical protein